MGSSGQWTPEHTGRRIRAACLQGLWQEEERQPGAEQPEHDCAQGNYVSARVIGINGSGFINKSEMLTAQFSEFIK